MAKYIVDSALKLHSIYTSVVYICHQTLPPLCKGAGTRLLTHLLKLVNNECTYLPELVNEFVQPQSHDCYYSAIYSVVMRVEPIKVILQEGKRVIFIAPLMYSKLCKCLFCYQKRSHCIQGHKLVLFQLTIARLVRHCGF